MRAFEVVFDIFLQIWTTFKPFSETVHKLRPTSRCSNAHGVLQTTQNKLLLHGVFEEFKPVRLFHMDGRQRIQPTSVFGFMAAWHQTQQPIPGTDFRSRGFPCILCEITHFFLSFHYRNWNSSSFSLVLFSSQMEPTVVGSIKESFDW